MGWMGWDLDGMGLGSDGIEWDGKGSRAGDATTRLDQGSETRLFRTTMEPAWVVFVMWVYLPIEWNWRS